MLWPRKGCDISMYPLYFDKDFSLTGKEGSAQFGDPVIVIKMKMVKTRCLIT